MCVTAARQPGNIHPVSMNDFSRKKITIEHLMLPQWQSKIIQGGTFKSIFNENYMIPVEFIPLRLPVYVPT